MGLLVMNQNIYIGMVALMILFIVYVGINSVGLPIKNNFTPAGVDFATGSVRNVAQIQYHHSTLNRQDSLHSRDSNSQLQLITKSDFENQTHEGHMMCACGRCYDVTCSVNNTGHLSMVIRKVTKGGWNISAHIGDGVSYFYIRMIGQNYLTATIVSDQDRRLEALQPIRAESSGIYNITLTLIHANKSSAYGLDKWQDKELNCPLCLINSTCHLSVDTGVLNNPPKAPRLFHWVPSLKEPAENRSCIYYGNTCYYFIQNISNSLPQTPWQPTASDERCFRMKKFLLIGDSHERMIGQRLMPWTNQSGWQIMTNGYGILHNESPDKNITAYIAGEIPSVYKQGGMLRRLSNGYYRALQDEENFDGWLFSVGHWDLRDVSLKEYVQRLRRLFVEWDRFRKESNDVPLFWIGIPPYSYRRGVWGGHERRTNVKIALADAKTKELCSEFNVSFIPFFDIGLPFYTSSCDTHHYLCPLKASPIGEAQLRVLLTTICA